MTKKMTIPKATCRGCFWWQYANSEDEAAACKNRLCRSHYGHCLMAGHPACRWFRAMRRARTPGKD